jgi:hypothetical protein
MFVLNPGGGSGSNSNSKGRQQLWFFAQLGLYFTVLRGVYVFFTSREDRSSRSIQEN